MLIIDVSSNNREPNWAALKRAGVGAAWIKATEGTGYTNPFFAPWRKAANKAGLRVGAYHFARPLTSLPFDEAAHFVNTVDHVNRSDLRPVLDYEEAMSNWNDAWIEQFNQTVKDSLGVGPLFYSYPGLIEGLRLRKPVGYGLWLAAYSRNDGVEHPYSVPAPWKHTVAHQFSSRCTVTGCDGLVDLSRATNPRAVLAHPLLG